MGGPFPQPDLITARLRLRPLAAADAVDVRRLAGDFAVAETTLSIPHPYPDGAAEAWIASLAGPEARGQVVYAVTERTAGTFFGVVGLVVEPHHLRAELGYWVGVPYWGRGYATEAARAVLEYAFETLALHRVHACHFGRNPASGRVLEKIGMRREGVARAHVRRWERYEDLVLYGALRGEWGH